jgi:ADP-ribose pyrophosphatase YjhB (NUDIX family)
MSPAGVVALPPRDVRRKVARLHMPPDAFTPNPRPTVIVVITVVEFAGKLLLIQESKPDFRDQWNLPGGRLEPGESLQAAARREVVEEAGIEVRLTGLLALDQRMLEPALGPDRLRVVFAGEPCGGRLKQEADEHSLCAAWFEPGDLARLSLRTPFVARMVDLAASRPVLLPITSVDLMTADERRHERRPTR